MMLLVIPRDRSCIPDSVETAKCEGAYPHAAVGFSQENDQVERPVGQAYIRIFRINLGSIRTQLKDPGVQFTGLDRPILTGFVAGGDICETCSKVRSEPCDESTMVSA